MNSEALVQLALDHLSCTQKELAANLGVSPTQVSKWKKGEHLSSEMEVKLRMIANIGDKDPEFVLWSGSLEEATKWERLIQYLAEMAQYGDETGYRTCPLEDEMEYLCRDTFHVLRELGVTLPKKFPQELDVDYETDIDELSALIEENPYSALIYEIYRSLTNIYGFYAAYVADLINDDELDLLDTPACNIEPCLMSLAACKIEEDAKLMPKFREFKHRITKDYVEWLTITKDKAFRSGVPLKAELLGLVYDSNNELGYKAEAESLGFNASRVHPDIYMNELLIGMRTIHQVLPAIMKKLKIYEEFKLDSSEFRIT